MEPQKKKLSCLDYLEVTEIVELVSDSFGDDEQSLRIFKTFLSNKEDTTGFFNFKNILPLMIKDTDPPLAALKGRFSVVKWLFPYLDIYEDVEVCIKMCEKAAEGGHLEILKWLRGVGCPWDSRTVYAAAMNGHLDCLKWADDNGCKWDWSVCAFAAERGHLECLKWTMGPECRSKLSVPTPLDTTICMCAAAGGSLECLQWARENGCRWNATTCTHAAKNGHLHCLKWARENGCHWDKDTCFQAASNGHLHCLKWARENGCPEN